MARFNRRSFLSRSGAAAAAPLVAGAAPGAVSITLVLDGNDAVAGSRPVLQAMHALQLELAHAGFAVHRAQAVEQANGPCIVAASSTSPVAAGALAAARIAQPVTPESLALFEATIAGHAAVMACGADARGLMYAIYEMVDRVRCKAPLKFPHAVVEQPANPVRSIMRQFTSEAYDKPWFYDRAMWPQYLTMLAANRFNRLDLAFGLSYDMLVKVDDPYLVFAYPFLIAVPGYDVKVTNLSDAERARNLAALRTIADQTVAHGLDFQLGLWMHGYELKDSPNAKYLVTGLSPDNHAAYCRDALTALLKGVPAISSVGLRIHGESGVAEGSYEFWKTVFAGVAASGRRVEIDLHAKGIDDTMIANALATGLPVNVSPKFAAEHIGLPYHQADIRPSEIPAPGAVGEGLMKLSAGQRSFTRYGYADLLREDRKYTVRTRVFYGSQRILASGSAAAAAAYGRAFRFCGMTGADLMEPLTFRGRRGTAVAGTRRSGYLPAPMEPQYDWQKYDTWYRSVGRMMFNPDGDPVVVRRCFAKTAQGLSTALEAASMILPLVTQAHSVSAACDIYWPEIAFNMPIASEAPDLFFDTPKPRTAQNVTALDPQLFSSCAEFAGELMSERSGKYSPMETAAWLTALAKTAEDGLGAGKIATIDEARLRVDVEIQIGLGRFFADKLAAGVYYALFEKTGHADPLNQALSRCQRARASWAKIVERAHGVYADDLSISDRFTERGAWTARLQDIDADIAAMSAKLSAANTQPDEKLAAIIARMASSAIRSPLPCTHTPPTTFVPGRAVDLVIAVREGLTRATLRYRHVNSAERWIGAEMTSAFDGWRAQIPAAYTDSPYPLQYYFEFRAAPDRAWLWPGLGDSLLNQPYVVVRAG